MIQDAMPFVIQFVNHQNVTPHVKNQKMLFVMLNVKNLIVNFTALIKLVQESIVQNVLQFAKHHIVSLIVRPQSQNVKPFVKNQNVIGNVLSHNAQNQSVN